MTTHLQIPKEALIAGRWYAGRGRNADIGMWNGEDFLVLAEVGQKVGPGGAEGENGDRQGNGMQAGGGSTAAASRAR